MEPNRTRCERLPRISNTPQDVQAARNSSEARNASQLGRYAHELVMFARMWLPYGGAPAEEIFERFGMSNRRFREVLWFSIRHSGVDVSEQHALATVYPRASVGLRSSVRTRAEV